MKNATNPMLSRPDAAFTLIELLTVIVIIGILAGLVLGTMSKVRSGARRARCLSNLRQLHLAVVLYADDNKDLIVQNLPVINGYQSITWVEALAPYLQVPATAVTANDVRPTGVFACPASTLLTRSGGKSDYGKNYQANGTASGKLKMNAVALPNRVILLADANHGTLPENCGRDLGAIRPAARHGGRANVMYFDGHVKVEDPQKIRNADLAKLPWSVSALE
ncbi:MAG: prepilin-type N-terminal cleavage/methylation domain-containing protein [Opitutaceae bacterium]|nr:prepilin-type N-terminal cleavage/methylation domain-containing protein [Opitutaceae bacterium]